MGVTFTENLSFNRHVDLIVAKAYAMLGFVKRVCRDSPWVRVDSPDLSSKFQINVPIRTLRNASFFVIARYRSNYGLFELLNNLSRIFNLFAHFYRVSVNRSSFRIAVRSFALTDLMLERNRFLLSAGWYAKNRMKYLFFFSFTFIYHFMTTLIRVTFVLFYFYVHGSHLCWNIDTFHNVWHSDTHKLAYVDGIALTKETRTTESKRWLWTSTGRLGEHHTVGFALRSQCLI